MATSILEFTQLACKLMSEVKPVLQPDMADENMPEVIDFGGVYISVRTKVNPTYGTITVMYEVGTDKILTGSWSTPEDQEYIEIGTYHNFEIAFGKVFERLAKNAATKAMYAQSEEF